MKLPPETVVKMIIILAFLVVIIVLVGLVGFGGRGMSGEGVLTWMWHSMADFLGSFVKGTSQIVETV